MHAKKFPASMRTALLAGVLSTLLGGCFKDSPEQLVTDAKASLAKKETRKAEIELKNALQAKPDLGEARYLLGNLLLGRGDLSGAAIEFDKASNAGYKGDDLVAKQAQLLLRQGHADQVLTRFGQTHLQSAPDAAALELVLAEATWRGADKAAARAHVDAALKLDPSSAAAMIMDVRLRAAESGVDEALASMDKVLAKVPGSADAWLLKGKLLGYRARDKQGAADAYRHAIAADKTRVDGYVALMSLLIAEGDSDGSKKALADFKKAFPKHPMQMFFSAGDQMQSGDLKSARETILQVLKVAPDDPHVHTLAGRIELARGNALEAERHFEQAAMATPEAPDAKIMLATAELALGSLDKAQKTIEPLLVATPPNIDALNLAGEIKLYQRDPAWAERFYAQAAAARPTDMRSRLALASLQLGKPGQQAQAIEKLRALAAEDKGIKPDLALAAALVAQHDFEGALKAVDNLDRKQPGLANPPFMRGSIELNRGDKVKARADFEEAVKRTPSFLPAVKALASLDLADGQLPVAIKRFENLVAAAPNNTDAVMGLVELKQRAGVKPEELKKILGDATRANPTAIAPRAALVRMYLREKDNRAALSAVQEVLALQPDNVEALELQAQVTAVIGDANQTLTTLNKIVSLVPNSATPLIHLADFQSSQKDWTGALQSLKRAQAVQPDQPDVDIALVRTLTSAGRLDEARTAARAVQQRLPKAPTGFLLEGEAAMAAKQYPQAVTALRAGLDRAPNGMIAIALLKAINATGDKAAAAAFETSWLKAHPKDAEFIYYLGDTALSKGDRTEALARYQSVLEIQPGNALAMNNVAWLLARDKPQAALEMAEKVNKSFPNQPAYMDTMAEVLAANGKLDAAIELQRRALGLAPDLSLHRLHLAQYLVKAGKKAEAKVELDKLAALGSRFPLQDEVKKLQAGL